MNPGKNQLPIPFKNLLFLMIGLAAVIQLIVISYNHISGFYTLYGVVDFLTRFFWGTFLSIIGTFLIALPDLLIISFLNKKLPWHSHLFRRLMLQFLFTVIFAIAASLIITLISHFISAYREALLGVLITNALIFSVSNVILMIILEAWIFFIENRASKLKTETLEKELSQIRFEVLKNQINPHFMFNSLNVLSGLIDKDAAKAQLFIEEFSHIYRYVLETIEQPVATLEAELGFARSYMFLQQIRYGSQLVFDVKLPADMLQMFLPPLSLQTVLENAIKHNLISDTKALHISISHQGLNLIIQNNIQPKISSPHSTGLGQKNLVKRYAQICEEVPEFRVRAQKYEVILPLISE